MKTLYVAGSDVNALDIGDGFSNQFLRDPFVKDGKVTVFSLATLATAVKTKIPNDSFAVGGDNGTDGDFLVQSAKMVNALLPADQLISPFFQWTDDCPAVAGDKYIPVPDMGVKDKVQRVRICNVSQNWKIMNLHPAPPR